jgi:hypothetical protein
LAAIAGEATAKMRAAVSAYLYMDTSPVGSIRLRFRKPA